MAEPSDIKEMRLAQRETPPPRLLATAASVPLPASTTEPSKWPSRKLVAVIVCLTTLIGLGTVAVKYVHLTGAAELQRPVTPDLLRVSAIALGKVPVAIVNGKQVEEGKWLEVQTPEGPATLRVTKIEDGIVHFRYGRQTIDARLGSPSSAEKKSLR